MENQIFWMILFVLAAVGLSQLCAWVARWLCRSSSLEGSFLVLVISDRDSAVEARLTQACSEVCLCQGLRGAQVLLLRQGDDPETTRLCRHLCASRGVPFLESPEDLSRTLQGAAPLFQG